MPVQKCLLVLSLLASSASFAGEKVKIDPATAVKMVSTQQTEDPVIGVWSGAAGGYTWQTAIVKNPDQANDGYEFVGVLLQPWPTFKKGEVHIYLNKTSAVGVYEGKEKWKSLFGSSWSGARFYLQDGNELTQTNNIRFDTPLGSNWILLRQPIPSQRQTQPLHLKHAGNEIQTAQVASPEGENLVRSVLFVWFDEEQPQPGTKVIEAAVTARAYEGVLSLLREVRGANTSVKWGFSVLETNYHPPTQELGHWIAQQPSAEKLTSVFYWEDEALGETTPIMNFYMTQRAYQGVMTAVQNYFAGVQQSQQVPPEKRKRLTGFLTMLQVVAQGALQGMANYYTTVRPFEEQRLAQQQAAASQAYAAQQQVWELQKLNQQLDQMNTQIVLDRIRTQGEQYSRMLQRFSTGSWPR